MSKVGMLNLEVVKQKANEEIDQLLRHTWLDPETIREFGYQRKRLQEKPFMLERLCGKIKQEIEERKQKYGR